MPYPGNFDLQGTVDHSAWLAVPEGLAFWRAIGGWDQVQRNADLLRRGADHVRSALGTGDELGGLRTAPCLTTVPLPAGVAVAPAGAEALWQQLYAAGFVVPPVSFEGGGLVRLAAQVYNDEDDFTLLAEALPALMRSARS